MKPSRTSATDSTTGEIARQFGIVLLYHSVTDDLHSIPDDTVHNVEIGQFVQHIDLISQHFRFVSLDQYAEAPDKSGLAAVTFDDGYRNVPDNAAPILIERGIPFTLFLNAITLSGRWNWRDKVRQIIADGDDQDFCSRFPLRDNRGRFYRSSKLAANASDLIEQNLDLFMGGKCPSVYARFPYLSASEVVLSHPLCRIGNHTARHYVLSSLCADKQREEIVGGLTGIRAMLAACHAEVSMSRIFSAPFGGDHDINDTTIRIVREQRYSALAMSRQRLQSATCAKNGLPIIERFMPRKNLAAELASAVTGYADRQGIFR